MANARRGNWNVEHIKIGDYVCVSEGSAYAYDLNWWRAQAIGQIKSIPHEGRYLIYFPDRVFTAAHLQPSDAQMFYADEIRKASAYEGMMAFWDPEEENDRVFGVGWQDATQHGTPISHMDMAKCVDDSYNVHMKEDKRIAAAREKAEIANLRVEDF